MQSGCNYLKIIFFCILVCLLPNISFAKITTCPPLDLIQRTPGQNGWNTLFPGWQGRFDSPLIGQGFSSAVARFGGVRWIKLNNLPDGPGKIECDYEGNYDGELIRFDQAGYYSTPRPVGAAWSCKVSAEFPTATCECAMGVEFCEFDSDARDPDPSPEPDMLELLDSEFQK